VDTTCEPSLSPTTPQGALGYHLRRLSLGVPSMPWVASGSAGGHAFVLIMMLPLASSSGVAKALCSTPLKWKAQKHALYRTESLTISCLFYPTGIARSGYVWGPAFSRPGLGHQCGVAWGGSPLSSSYAPAAVKDKGPNHHIFTSRTGFECRRPAQEAFGPAVSKEGEHLVVNLPRKRTWQGRKGACFPSAWLVT